MDMKTAFSYGDIEKKIYMSQPKSFVKRDKYLVCRLNKSWYSLKQAPSRWYKQFDSFFMSIGFDKFEADHCVYFYSYDDRIFCTLLLYINDVAIARNSKNQIST